MNDLIRRQDALKVSSMDSGIYIGINNLQPVDAVEVVRCGECANRYKVSCPLTYMAQMDANEDDYCSRGERKTDVY